MKKSIHRIEELGKVVGGGTPKTEVSEFWGGEIPWLSPSDLTGYKKVFIERGSKNITELGLKKSSTVMLPKNTVLLSSRAPIGYIALARNSICTNQGFKSIICNEKVFPLYLYYYLKENVETLKNFASGATFPELSASRLKHIKIEICDGIETQKKIAFFLYKYDELIENNNKRINNLEEMIEEIYKEWFVRFRFPGYENYEFENGIPKGWEIEKVKMLVKRLPFGITYKEDELMSEGKVVVIDQSKNDILGFHDDNPSHYATLDNPIILFGDHSCKFKLMITEFSLGENIIPFISKNNEILSEYYLFYSIHKLITTEEYKRHWSRLVGFKILVPEMKLQKKFEKFAKTICDEKYKLELSNRKLIMQRDLLLPRLMSGKLEVKSIE